MSNANVNLAVDSSLSPPLAVDRSRYLYGPKTDFLLLGGLGLLIFPILLVIPTQEYRGLVAIIMLALANVINHPHFAHSYQIFYRRLPSAINDTGMPFSLRRNYVIAGVIVPILLIAYFAIGIANDNVRWVGFAGNFMAFFVGWHYVKQGYGMLMVDAALKKNFFGDKEKKLLLFNGYITWITSWMIVNDQVHKLDLWGLKYYSFDMPSVMIYGGIAAASLSGIAVLYMLYKRVSSGKGFPVNGVVAYGVSLYLWLLFVRIDPVWGLITPALHSIQYLAVVYRYQSNFELHKTQSAKDVGSSSMAGLIESSTLFRMIIFSALGISLGALLFWLIPNWLDSAIAYDSSLYGASLFLFMFWIFVNVHHYFIDSVIWKRDNPETKMHLFAANSTALR